MILWIWLSIMGSFRAIFHVVVWNLCEFFSRIKSKRTLNQVRALFDWTPGRIIITIIATTHHRVDISERQLKFRLSTYTYTDILYSDKFEFFITLICYEDVDEGDWENKVINRKPKISNVCGVFGNTNDFSSFKKLSIENCGVWMNSSI